MIDIEFYSKEKNRFWATLWGLSLLRGNALHL